MVSTLAGERSERFCDEGAELVGDGRGICTDDVTAIDSWNTSHCSSRSSVSLPGIQMVRGHQYRLILAYYRKLPPVIHKEK